MLPALLGNVARAAPEQQAGLPSVRLSRRRCPVGLLQWRPSALGRMSIPIIDHENGGNGNDPVLVCTGTPVHIARPFHSTMTLKVCYFLKLVAVTNRLGIAIKPFLWASKWVVWLIPPVVCPRWLVKLAFKLIGELAKKSRADADALFAMDVLKTVHGGGFPMFRDRITLQMCREPDEDHACYSSVARGNMNIMVYKLPSGCRMWFNVLAGSSVVGSGILQPGESDDEMFWKQSKSSHEQPNPDYSGRVRFR